LPRARVGQPPRWAAGEVVSRSRDVAVSGEDVPDSSGVLLSLGSVKSLFVVRAERDLPTPRRWKGSSLDGGMEGDLGCPESLRLLALAWVAWEATLGNVKRGLERTRANFRVCLRRLRWLLCDPEQDVARPASRCRLGQRSRTGLEGDFGCPTVRLG
jgi:hypothetical protein